jgi:microsomal dipeptidase-like Zn-dependent dipeptidase
VCADLQAALVEPDTNASPVPASDPLRGFADLHVHMFAHLGFGGAVVTGKPYSNVGVADALKSDFGSDLDLVDMFGAELPRALCPASVPDCGRVMLHGDHILFDDPVGIATQDRTRTHFGAPVFNGWPTWHATTHQQVYYKWLERAWRGGMRLMVMLAVHNEALCRLSKHMRDIDCADSMLAIDQQLMAAHEFEAWLNGQAGGGWLEIVGSSAEAERVIREGKLAVVLGIEVDSLFNCKANAPCTRDYLRREIAHYHDDFKVRHIYPVHNFDNGMLGTAVWMDFLNVGNRIIEGSWYDVAPCETSDFVLSRDPFFFGLGAAVNAVLNLLDPANDVAYPAYPLVPGCNTRGLSESGVALIEELMNAGMMIDIDHMSSRSVAETLNMARERDYPVSVGHGVFADQHAAAHTRHERMRTAAELDAIRRLGGIVSVMTTADLQPGGYTVLADGRELHDACELSSTSFAQNYLYAVRALAGEPIAFGSDFNGLAPHVGPRFGDAACNGNASQWAAQVQDAQRLSYPFTLPGFGVFERQVTGQRKFDFNVDGLAHIGMLPDLIADMMTLGLTEVDLDPLMKSAGAYVEAWSRAEAQTIR